MMSATPLISAAVAALAAVAAAVAIAVAVTVTGFMATEAYYLDQ